MIFESQIPACNLHNQTPSAFAIDARQGSQAFLVVGKGARTVSAEPTDGVVRSQPERYVFPYAEIPAQNSPTIPFVQAVFASRFRHTVTSGSLIIWFMTMSAPPVDLLI